MLAAVAAGAVDQAVLLTGAGVGCIALLTPPEEALHVGGWGREKKKKERYLGEISPRLGRDAVTFHSLSLIDEFILLSVAVCFFVSFFFGFQLLPDILDNDC